MDKYVVVPKSIEEGQYVIFEEDAWYIKDSIVQMPSGQLVVISDSIIANGYDEPLGGPIAEVPWEVVEFIEQELASKLEALV